MRITLLTQEELDTLYRQIDDLRAEKAELQSKVQRIPGSELTRAELRVLVMVAQGYADKQIAGRYHLADKTVLMHMHHILTKLGVTNRTQAAIWAWRQGIVCPHEAWETVKTLQWRSIPIGR